MQRVRTRFQNPDNSKHGSLQSCVRTNDLELVGDGSHLTYFQMLGNFSFGGGYQESVELWHSLLKDLKIEVEPIHYHPDRLDHKELWTKRGYSTVEDVSCLWTDGQIGGYCCEVYSRGLEIGNLVNTLDHSADVGFGWERLHQIVEGKSRVDETSLFGKHHPIVSDHSRTLEMFWKNGIVPGMKYRNYICRRLLRRMIPHLTGSENFVFGEWLDQEKEQSRKRLREAKKIWKKYRHQTPEWWWKTCGILPEEIPIIGS